MLQSWVFSPCALLLNNTVRCSMPNWPIGTNEENFACERREKNRAEAISQTDNCSQVIATDCHGLRLLKIKVSLSRWVRISFFRRESRYDVIGSVDFIVRKSRLLTSTRLVHVYPIDDKTSVRRVRKRKQTINGVCAPLCQWSIWCVD